MLDESSVASLEGVTFHLNEAAKHPENPVLLPGEPHQWDSLQISWPATVLYSPGDRKFRCWYAGLDVVQTPERCWRTGYAESNDAVRWSKPELGQVTFLGQPTNQIKPERGNENLSFVFENPLPAAPASERFGGYWIEYDADSWRKGLAWSADGKAWVKAGTAYQKADRGSYHDISQLLYDAEEADPAWRVKGYTQVYRDLPHPLGEEKTVGLGVRVVGLVHGNSVTRVDDAADPVALLPEPGIDEEIHFGSVSKVHGQYLMLFESDRFSKNPIHGDLRLAVSSDGRKFRRVHPHQALVPTGPKGTWDENLLVTTSAALQMVGDELYIFYIGCPNLYNSWPRQYAVQGERRGAYFAPCYMGLATLPRDRYAYAAGPGTITSRPASLAAGEVWVNADGEPTIATRGANRHATGHLGQERVHTVYRKVVWHHGTPGGEVALEFVLRGNDRIYSFGYA